MSQAGQMVLGHLFGVPHNHQFTSQWHYQNTSICGRFRILNKIGRGVSSVVYYCENTVLRRVLAMKIITREDGTAEAEHERLIRHEFDMQLLLSGHRSICTAHALLQVFPDSYILMDCYEGNLSGLIQGSHSANTPYNIKSLFLDVIDGVIHCHRNDIAHRNLNAYSIGVANNSEDGMSSAVLLEFRHAVSPLLSTRPAFRGKRQYCAPELRKTSPPGDMLHNLAAADTWSLGVLLFQMVTGNFPFFGYRSRQRCKFYRKYQKGEQLQTRAPEISIELEDILRAIFKEEPSERIDLHQLRILVLNCPTFYSTKGVEYTGTPHPRELETRHWQRPDQAPHYVQEHYQFMGQHLSNTYSAGI
ncbi:hypothetical protein IFR05_006579 [Cadophora sp. M221]|nr:hypothetical protein IFR05_006579 [Cadophora sp. M221]